MRRSTRREVIVAAGAGAFAAAAAPPAFGKRLRSRRVQIGPGAFRDGVASGDPAPTAVTLWSRLRTDRPRSGARLIVARDAGLNHVVATARVSTGIGVNGTLKARVGRLQPATEYFYAWESTTGVSPVGRTRTLPPPDSQQPVRLAFSSCQHYSRGFFSPHAHAATQEMDLYVFLGDYIYERRRVVAGDVRADRINANDLPSYRAKYQLYRSDAGLRELHRVQPAVHIWDDHEIANNYSERTREPALMQRTAGYRAALEWLPRQVPRNDRFRIYRRFHVGARVEVFLLDTRQYRTPAVGGSPRRILDETQMRWLISGLQRSTATWKVVAQQVTIAASPTGRPSRDDWDGYPEDRARLLGAIEAAGIPNVLFLTGDAHVFACNHLASDFTALGDTGARPSAVEYVGGSVTSPGTIRDEAVVRANSPWVQEYNAAEHGYAYLTLDAAQAVTEYRRSDLSSPSGATATFERFTQPAGANRVARESFLV